MAEEGNMYAVYNPDGSIYQCNVVYGQPNYGKLLAEHYMPYARAKSPTLLSSNKWYVHTGTEQLLERKPLRIRVSRTTIKAGAGREGAVFRGIPKGCALTVTALGGDVIHSIPDFPDAELDLRIPVPCTYRVRFSLWPYQDYESSIEAV